MGGQTHPPRAEDDGNDRWKPPFQARPRAHGSKPASRPCVRSDLPQAQEPTRKAALEVAEIVRTLDADEDVVIAAMLQPLLEEKLLDRDAAERQFGEAAVQLARALSQLGQFGLPADWTPERGLESCPGRGAAQDAGRGGRRRAPGRGEARRTAAADAHGEVARRAAPAQARRRDPRGLRAARQPARRLAGQVGTGGPGLPLSAARRLPAHRRGLEGAPRPSASATSRS